MSAPLPPSGFDPFGSKDPKPPKPQPPVPRDPFAPGGGFPPAGGGFPASGGGFPPAGSGVPPANPFAPAGGAYPPPGSGYPAPGSEFPPQQSPAFAYTPGPSTSPLAIVSLLSGMAAWVTCCCSPVAIVASLVSIVTGHTALIQISRGQGMVTGKGPAIIGLVAGYLGILLSVGMILTSIFKANSVPNAGDITDVQAGPANTAEAALSAAERKIISNSEGSAKGNSAEAIAIAEKFATEMKTLREALFTEDKKKAFSLSDGEFITWCELRDDKCAFVVHVPAYRKFDDEAKDSLAELAWMSAQNAVEGKLNEGDQLAVGLKGTFVFGAVMVGKVGPEAEYDDLTTEKENLYSFFEPEPPLTELPEDAGMIKLPEDGSSKVLQFTDANFQAQVLDSDQPVLVDFWAAWCGPCRTVAAPMIDEAAAEYAGQVKFGKLDVDDNQKSPADYDVAAIPTLIIFKDGKPVERIVGVPSKAKLKQALEAAKAK